MTPPDPKPDLADPLYVGDLTDEALAAIPPDTFLRMLRMDPENISLELRLVLTLGAAGLFRERN